MTVHFGLYSILGGEWNERDGVGYREGTHNIITEEQSRELHDPVKELQPNCLLNVCPDHLGRIPAPLQDILREVGRRLAEGKQQKKRQI